VVCDPSGCGGGGGASCAVGRQYAGYTGGLVGIGSTASTNIDDEFDYLNNTGFVAGWVGVTLYSGNTPIKWLQAGLTRGYGGALDFYIEYNSGSGASIVYSAAVPSYNVAYPVSIYHVGNGIWRATINGYSYTANVNPSMTTFTSEALNNSSSCNTLEFAFSSADPWTTSQMGPPEQDYPYWVDSPTSHGWTSVGP
jgi:hypothetical protein